MLHTHQRLVRITTTQKRTGRRVPSRPVRADELVAEIGVEAIGVVAGAFNVRAQGDVEHRATAAAIRLAGRRA
jgi:hypothetical protein